jgi:hypothetical protein
VREVAYVVNRRGVGYRHRHVTEGRQALRHAEAAVQAEVEAAVRDAA